MDEVLVELFSLFRRMSANIISTKSDLFLRGTILSRAIIICLKVKLLLRGVDL